MSRAAARFRQADITRALKAIKAAGVPMAVCVELDGTIRLTPAAHMPGEVQAPSPVKKREIVL